jgi:hypothetical protein
MLAATGVIPAKAGTHGAGNPSLAPGSSPGLALDPRLRGGDGAFGAS